MKVVSGIQNPARIAILDPLRGLAAVSVCLYHFVCGNKDYLPQGDPLRSVASYGHLGVPVFFVISGFVICYSLGQRNYQLADAPGFLWRRLKRLEPPYLGAIVISVGLTILASRVPGFSGPKPEFTALQLAAHLGYGVEFLGFDWVNPVFWTLALEFQFYLLMALCFPLLNQQSGTRSLLPVIGLSLLYFVAMGHRSVVFHWMPLFTLGITCWAAITCRIRPVQALISYGVAGILVFVSTGAANLLAGLLTAAVITIFQRRPVSVYHTIPAWLGTFSYSLYLLHVPFGTRITNLSLRFPNEWWVRYLAVLLALALTIVVSRLFWHFVEKPSARWAQHRPAFIPAVPLSP